MICAWVYPEVVGDKFSETPRDRDLLAISQKDAFQSYLIVKRKIISFKWKHPDFKTIDKATEIKTV